MRLKNRLLVVSSLLSMFGAASASAQTRVLIFDDLGLPDNTVVTNQYSGVTFSAPGGNTTQVVTASNPLFPNEPQGLYNDPGFVEPIIVDLSVDHSAAGAFIDFGGVGGGITIEAFDGPGGTGNLLGSDSTTSETFIGVEAAGIKSVVFSQTTSGATYLIDNVTLTPSEQKTVIDFQALEHVDGNITPHGDSYSEDGFTLNGPALTTFGTQERRYPGSTAIFSNANAGLIEVVQDNGGAYSAESVDLVPLNNGNAPTTVIFNGELGGVNVANQSFTTNSIGFVLETFNFNSDFANIDRLTWTQDNPFNQVDNISVLPAGGIILDPVSRGWVNVDGVDNGGSSENNYLVGNCGLNDCGVGEFRNWFQFDLSNVNGQIIAAELIIDSAHVTLLQNPQVITYNVTSYDGSMNFATMGNGTFYGTREYTVADTDVVHTIPLSGAALADLNNTNGIWGTSGRISLGAKFGPVLPDQMAMGASNGGDVTQLRLVIGDACPADLDGDGDTDADDFFAYLDAFAGGNLPVCDIDGDGDCDADDFFGYLDLFVQGC